MKDHTTLESFLKSLPETAKHIKAEADQFGRSVLNTQLKKADIVTREDFEQQRQLLQAALDKLQQLEEKINQLENQ